MQEANLSEKEIIEDRVIDWITISADSRLIAFKPEESLTGVDLIVKKRAEYEVDQNKKKENSAFKKMGFAFASPKNKKAKEVSLQVLASVNLKNDDNFVKDILQDSFKPSKDFYLVFVNFDDVEQEINDFVWMIPSLEFRDIAEHLKFEASINTENKNKFSRFLVNKTELGRILLKIIEL